MHNRFAPGLPKKRKVFEHLKITLAHNYSKADQLWIEAYSAVTGANTKSMSGNEARNLFWNILAARDEEIPWEFYNMISELIKPLPLAIKETTIKDIKIVTDDPETQHSFEYLRISPNGHWQIIWEVNPDEDAEYREVGFDWYFPPDQANFPIVPIAIIDCIAGCVLLLRKNLVLPAASILSIALEAALWEALKAKGISRSTTQQYAPVEWYMRSLQDKLILTIEGADKNIRELGTLFEPGKIHSFELRRGREDSSNGIVELNINVNKNLVNFLASERVVGNKTNNGLSAAIQRARSADTEFFPRNYDDTLIKLRNNLIHLPPRNILDEPIPIPGIGQLQTIEDVRKKRTFINQLLYLVINVIRIAYTN